VYVLTQFIAGILSGQIGVALCIDLAPSSFAEVTFEYDEGMYSEFIWTFLLASVVLNVTCSSAEAYQNNSFFGLVHRG